MKYEETTEPDAPEKVKVARDLREITRLTANLEDEAVNLASSPLMPGGDAMVMLAGVANLEAWGNLVDTALRLAYESGDEPPEMDEDDDWEPPLQTLCFWSEQWREEHNRASDMTPTVTSETAFLASVLDWAWDNEPNWDDFAKDIRVARVRIENTLKSGIRSERTRTPCTNDSCKNKPRLVKVYATAAKDDFYKCPGCKWKYTPEEFLRAQHNHMAGAERFVKLQDAIAVLPRPERTIRQWLADCKVRAYCDVVTHQVWVWWPDIRELHRDTPTRRRVA